MTRWKREPTTTLRLMHGHNQFSNWHYTFLEAAEALGLVVGFRQYPNGSGDGSWDREWYVMTDQLAAIGGREAVHAKADEMREAAE